VLKPRCVGATGTPTTPNVGDGPTTTCRIGGFGTGVFTLTLESKKKCDETRKEGGLPAALEPFPAFLLEAVCSLQPGVSEGVGLAVPFRPVPRRRCHHSIHLLWLRERRAGGDGDYTGEALDTGTTQRQSFPPVTFNVCRSAANDSFDRQQTNTYNHEQRRKQRYRRPKFVS
jgi:hypothetical protein